MTTGLIRRGLLVSACAAVLLLPVASESSAAGTPPFWTCPFGPGVEVAQFRTLTLPYAVSDVKEAEVRCYLRIYTVKGNVWDTRPDEWTLVRRLPMGTVRAVKQINFGPRPADYPFSFIWSRVDLDQGVYWCRVAATDGRRWASTRAYGRLRVLSPVQINGGDSFTNTPSVTLDYPAVTGWDYFKVRNRNEPFPDAWQAVPIGGYSGPWELPSASDGLKTVAVAFTDAPGGPVTVRSDSIVLDRQGPVTTAPHPERGKKGEGVWLHFRFDDALCRQARVGFSISKGGAEYKRIGPRWEWGGFVDGRKFTCDLPRGRYTFTVLATDVAGNEQSKAGSNTLTVE